MNHNRRKTYGALGLIGLLLLVAVVVILIAT